MRTEADAAEVRAAALAYVGRQSHPVVVNYQLVRILAEHLDLRLDDSTPQGRALIAKFTAQLRGQLDKMADKGELAKDVHAHTARYWSLTAWQEHLDVMEARRREREASRHMWDRLRAELALYGYQSTSGPGQPLQFDADTWLEIIAAVEAARAARAHHE